MQNELLSVTRLFIENRNATIDPRWPQLKADMSYYATAQIHKGRVALIFFFLSSAVDECGKIILLQYFYAN